MKPADSLALRDACTRLEHPSLAARLTALLGMPIEASINLLPSTWRDSVSGAAENAIHRALKVAITSLPKTGGSPPRDDLHKVIGMGSGAVGGFFGLPGTLVELPFITTVMLRSIADIARSEGEDLSDFESQLACVQVFALGGRPVSDDAAETGYYGLRMALAFHFSTISQRLITQGIMDPTLPATVHIVRGIAARFGIAVSDKVALQLVPLVGAASGAVINAIFMQHFQDMARGHFVVRRLEREYGDTLVRQSYERFAVEDRRQRRVASAPVLSS